VPSASAPPKLARRATTKPRCGAKSRQTGRPCKLAAGHGTDHPGFGHCKFHSGSTRAGKERAQKAEARTLADALHVEPHTAIQQSLDNANGMLAFFEAKIAALPERAVLSKGELNVWVREYRAANSDVAHYAKLAIDAGVDERRVRVVEALGSDLADVLAAIFDKLDLTPEQRRAVQPVVRAQLELLEGGQAA
jgi:hypothetical protein